MKPRTLTGQFVAIVVAAAISMALLAAVVSFQVVKRRAAADANALLDLVLTSVEQTIAAGTFANDKVLIAELLEGIVRHPQVDFAQVIDAEGVSVEAAADQPPTQPPSARKPPLEGILVTRALISPIDRKEVIGQLLVHADNGHLRLVVREQALLLGLVLIGLITVLALVLNAAALRVVVRPMSRLAKGLVAIKPGTDTRISLGGSHASDEIGTVVDAANRLLDDAQAALVRERAMRDEVASMEARYRQIFEYTSAGIFLLTPRFQLLSSNAAVTRITGTSPGMLESLRNADFFEHLFVDAHGAREMAARAHRNNQTVSADLEVRGRSGEQRWVHCLISVQNTDDPHNPHLIEGVIYDVTQRRMEELEAAYLAEHDALTGLKSRAFFHKVLHQYVERARSIHTPVTLIFIDLDEFKSVNDTYGHEAGDRVLIECGRRLVDMLHRSSDLAVRLGGDEFTVVLDSMGAEEPQTQDIARRIVKAMLEPIEIAPGTKVRIGASVGVASFPLHAGNSDDLLRAADKAMYAVKHLGRSAYRIADASTALSA